MCLLRHCGCLIALAGFILVQGCGASEQRASQVETHIAVPATVTALPTLSPTSDTAEPAIETLSPADTQDLGEIAYFQQELQRPDLDPTIRAGYEDQIATLRYWIGQRATARALGVTPNNVVTPFAADPTSTPYPRGMLPKFDGDATPPRLHGFMVATTGWFDGQDLAVYAGAPVNDASQGLVVILQDRPDGGVDEKWYPSPMAVGSLTIVEEQNSRFTLQSTSGTIFFFDLATRQFDTSVTQPTPTTVP